MTHFNALRKVTIVIVLLAVLLVTQVMKIDIATTSLLSVGQTGAAIASGPQGGVDDNNIPLGQPVDTNNGGSRSGSNAAGNQSTDPQAEVFTFPAVGDIRFTQMGDRFWNQGDFVEGNRTLSASANSVAMRLSIEPNGLTCDSQDHKLMIAGTTVGTFSVSAGDTILSKTFKFANIGPGSKAIRIETTRIVAPGCGSAGFPDGVSTFDLELKCTLSVNVNYTEGNLSLEFNLGTPGPMTWHMWLTFQTQFIPLWAVPLPIIDPSISTSFDIPGFPSLGKIGFVSIMTTSEGVGCGDFKLVDTGTSLSATPSAGELSDLFRGTNRTLPEAAR